jgi:hypothetical protein
MGVNIRLEPHAFGHRVGNRSLTREACRRIS